MAIAVSISMAVFSFINQEIMRISSFASPPCSCAILCRPPMTSDGHGIGDSVDCWFGGIEELVLHIKGVRWSCPGSADELNGKGKTTTPYILCLGINGGVIVDNQFNLFNCPKSRERSNHDDAIRPLKSMLITSDQNSHSQTPFNRRPASSLATTN